MSLKSVLVLSIFMKNGWKIENRLDRNQNARRGDKYRYIHMYKYMYAMINRERWDMS